MASQNRPSFLSDRGGVPAYSRLHCCRNCMEFSDILQIAEDGGVLEIGFAHLKAGMYLDYCLCKCGNESIFGERVVDDQYLISFLAIVELLPIAGVAQSNRDCLKSSDVGTETQNSSSARKRTHKETESGIRILYQSCIFAIFIDASYFTQKVVAGNPDIIQNDISVIDIVQPIFKSAVSNGNSRQHPMRLFASDGHDKRMWAL